MVASQPKPEVVAKLVANHRRFLEFLERQTGDRVLAEDLLQEAFVRGIDRIGALRDDESAVACGTCAEHGCWDCNCSARD